MVPGAVILGVGFLDPEMRYVAVSMMTVTAAFSSACMSGFRLNYLDIAPRSASVWVRGEWEKERDRQKRGGGRNRHREW